MIEKIEVFFVFLIIMIAFGVPIYFRHFHKIEESGQKYSVFLMGDFIPSKKVFPVKKGILVFEIHEGSCFLLDYGNKIGGSTYPWEKACFVTVAFGNETKKLSAAKCWMSIPRDGELMMKIVYNPKYFNPEKVRIFTGTKDNSPTGFTGGDLVIKICQYESEEKIGKFSEVEGIPKSPPSASAFEQKKVKTENGKKKSFLSRLPLPNLSDDGEKGLFAPFSEKKQVEIKRRNKASNDEAIRLLNKIFSPDKGEGGKNE